MGLEDDLIRKILEPKQQSNAHDSLLEKIHKQALDKMGLGQFMGGNSRANSASDMGLGRGHERNTSDAEKAQDIIMLDQTVRQNMQKLILAMLDLGDKKIINEILSDHIAFLLSIYNDINGVQK